MTATPSVTLLLAIWGAALSTFVVVRDSWRARRRANVSVTGVLMPTTPQEIGLVTTVSNTGHESIYLDRVVLSPLLARPWNSREHSLGAQQLPMELKPGQSFSTRPVALGLFQEALRFGEDLGIAEASKFRVLFYDAIGRTYSSQPMYLPIVDQSKGYFDVKFPWDESLTRSTRLRIRGMMRVFQRRS